MSEAPSRDELLEFARRHTLDVDGYYQDEKDNDPFTRELNAIKRQLEAVEKQRDKYKKMAEAFMNIKKAADYEKEHNMSLYDNDRFIEHVSGIVYDFKEDK